MDKYRSIYVLGYWSSVIFALTGVLYGSSMGILLSQFSLPEYTNLEEFIRLVEDGFVDFYTYSQLIAFLSCTFYVVVLCCVYKCCDEHNEIFGLLSVCFGLAFAILACLNYFVQFSIVRLSLNEGVTQNLEMLVQFNPKSLASAVNMLGWTLFLGLSALFLAMIFKGKGMNAAISLSFFSTSIFCLLGFIGYIVDSPSLQLIFQLGMTVGLTIGTILIAWTFKRRKTMYLPMK